MFEASLFANVVLLVALFVIVWRAQKRMVEEKCATFAGWLTVITSALAIEDSQKRFDRFGHVMEIIFNRANSDEEEETAKEQITFYLTRASLLRSARGATLADTGEHIRLLALDTADENDDPGNEMLEYIGSWRVGEKEPREIWGNDGLAAANLVAERKLLEIYRRKISAFPIKLF